MATMATTPAPTPTPQKRTVSSLTCNICPKKPTFSDLSHLLTHVSSKAHLSTYYNLKIRANAGCSVSRQIVNEYDVWYAENNIEAFMSERLNQKEERIRIKSEPGVNRAPSVKRDVKPRTVTAMNVPAAVNTAALTYSYPAPFAAMAPMYSWAPYGFNTQNQDPIHVDDDEEETPLAIPTAPVSRKRRSKAKAPATDGNPIDVAENDSSNLKGVYWPGMGLFDAASPEHKKMRNQKKDVSVNDRLASMSETVIKNEMVFSPGGSLSRVRDISGVPASDEEQLPGEEAPPRPAKAKRAPRRRVLADKDPNVIVDPSKAKKRGRKPKPVVAAQNPKDETDDDIGLTLESGRNKRKKVHVHRDEVVDLKEDIGHDDVEITFEQPAQMTHLTSGYTYTPMMHQHPAAAAGFRPAEPFMHGQAYYQLPTGHGNPFPYNMAAGATWDFFHATDGQYLGNPLFNGYQGTGSNPLFFGNLASDDAEEEDDEGTISAPGSDNE